MGANILLTPDERCAIIGKMKSLFVIAPHSFVDLITNSSSEIFICDTKKSVEAVETLLFRLLEMHNEMLDTPNHYSFSEVFGSVSAAEYSFDKEAFDPDLIRLYKSYDTWREYGNKTPRPASYYAAKQAEKALDESHPYHKTKWPSYENRSAAQRQEYDTCWREYRKQNDVIWTEYGAEKLHVVQRLFVNFLELNGFSDKDINLVKKLNKENLTAYLAAKNGEWGNLFYPPDSLPENLRKAEEFFSECLSWGYRVNKGNILVRSNGDNSIPYGLFDLIEQYLHARRYHLG
jgi:hypothetical protein